MSDEKKNLSKLDWHKKMAVELFNHTWNLLDKEDRKVEENDEMIHAAHASRYHWGVVVNSGKFDNVGPINIERGDWQVSHVYSILKIYESALYFAQRCLDICLENNIGDFDLAFAYEAMARAYSLGADTTKELDEYLKLAKEAGEKIAKDDDKKYFFSQLEDISSS